MPAKKKPAGQAKAAPKVKKAAKPKAPSKGGRPKAVSGEVIDRVCNEIASGKSIAKICAAKDMPAASTIWLTIRNDPKFSEQYARARENRADARADKIDDYVDQMILGKIDPQVARVAIDAEKWQAGKEKPSIYGEKLDVTTRTEVEPVTRESMIAMMRKSPAFLAQIESMVAEAKKPAKEKP